MTSFFISGSSQVAQTLAAGETGMIADSGTLYAANGPAVTMSGSAATLMVLGDVVAAKGNTISGTPAATSVSIGAAGSVMAGVGAAFSLGVTGSLQITNAGLVSGREALVATGSSGADAVVFTNSGTVMGIGSSSTGLITTTSSVETLSVFNGGLIQTEDIVALSMAGSGGMKLTNTGTIAASGLSVNAASDLTLKNSGTMVGGISYWDQATIRNTGLIDGDITDNNTSNAVSATIRNFGTITGGITFGDGNDLFVTKGGAVQGIINGGGGNDQFEIDRGDIVIVGGAGTDQVVSTVDYRMGDGVEILFLKGDFGLRGTGNATAETINGGVGNDTIRGLGGNDALSGLEGDDVVQAGGGDDVIAFTAGNDVIDGGGGRDLLVLSFAFPASSAVNLVTGAVTLTGTPGNDDGTATVSGIEDVIGTVAADSITGSAADNNLEGGLGADTLNGAAGNDVLDGGLDGDVQVGGAGNDTLIGSAGRDTMTGGSQTDTFIFGAVSDSAAGQGDLITDFERQREVIDVELVYGDPDAPVDVPFAFLSTGAFTGLAPELRYAQDAVAGTTTVEIRLAGSVANDMEIVLTGIINLSAANFVL